MNGHLTGRPMPQIDIYGSYKKSLSLDEKVKAARLSVDEAIREHNPVVVAVGVSGGTDSIATAHVVLEHLRDNEVKSVALHINTGIGIPATRTFVRDVCAKMKWQLLEYHADDQGESYEDLVLERGFPGPFMHRKMYNRLKERSIEAFVREHKESRMDRVLICTGIRAEESSRRMGINKRIDRRGAQVWLNPILDWTGQDKHEYTTRHNLPVNPVHKKIGMSGECLCGAYAHKGELDLVRLVCPATADRIERLQERVMERHPWQWDDPGPPDWHRLEQEGQRNLGDDFRPMCVGCAKRSK